MLHYFTRLSVKQNTQTLEKSETAGNDWGIKYNEKRKGQPTLLLQFPKQVS